MFLYKYVGKKENILMPEQINGLNIPSLQTQKPVYFKQKQDIQGQTQTPPEAQNQAEGQNGSAGANVKTPKSVSNTELGNRVKNSSDMTQSPYTLPVAGAVWYGIAQGMDKFGEKCNTEYDKSILGKVTGAADKLSNKVSNSSVAKSSFGQWVSKRYDSVAQYMDRVSSNPKNRIFYALRNHKTSPECKLVKIPAAGLDGFLEADTKNVFEELLKPADQAVKLKQYGLSKDVISEIEKLPKSEKLARIQSEEFKYFKESLPKFEEAAKKLSKDEQINKIASTLKAIGEKFGPDDIKDLAKKSDDEILKLLKDTRLKELKITKGLGFDSVAQYGKVMQEDYALKHMDEVLKILEKGDKNLKVIIWKRDGKLGKVTSHLMGREVGIQELINKFKISTKTGAKTKFGQLVGKSFAYLTEGTTNRFAGGKLAVFMQAFIFADMLIHTIQAPKGEKGKTLAERFVNDFSYFLAMPLGIWAMHKAGGLKYLGMTKDQVEAYRKALKQFNKEANLKLHNKKWFNLRSKALNRQLNAGVKNPFLKLLKKGANLLTIGLEQKAVYLSKDAKNMNLARKMWKGTKNVAGYPLRFIIPMFLLSPFIAKIATKGAHAVFGKPTNSVLDEDKEPEKEETKTAPNNTNPQASDKAFQGTNKIPEVKNPNEYKSDTNLIKMAANGQKAPQNATSNSSQTQTTNTTETTNTTTNSTDDKNKSDKEMEPVRTYIPSPVGMVKKSIDTSGLDSALAEADRAEQYIQGVLAENAR